MPLHADATIDWKRVDASRPLPTTPLQALEAHVWLMNLDRPLRPPHELSRWLSTDERDRAARFVFERDRRRYETGRGLLRLLLSGYLGSAAQSIVFAYGPAGKPALDGISLQFNVSHADAWLMLGVSDGVPIGVDIEAVRDMPDRDQVAQHNLTPAELHQLQRLPESLRTEGLIDVWTQKEAVLKALGEGLGTIALDRFPVPPSTNVAGATSTAEPPDRGALRWSLVRFEPEPAYRAAVAVQAGGAAFRFHRHD